MNIIEVIPLIRQALESKLENAANLSETLQSIIVGERSKASKMKPPMVWIYLTPATVDNTTMGLAEEWKWPIYVVSIIKDVDPEKGKTRAEQLALTASAAIMRDSVGNPDTTLSGLISDMRRTRWEPAYEKVYGQDQTLFGSLVEIELMFCTKEI